MEYTTILLLVLLFLLSLFLVTIFILAPSPRHSLAIEDEYEHPITSERLHHPSLFTAPAQSVTTSLIVPAYNEKDRIVGMLDEALLYFVDRKKAQPHYTYEIVVVDDGSTDATTKVVQLWAKRNRCEDCRVLTFVRNRGKGGAVTQGMLTARGEWILFADADGAAKFSDLDKLESQAKKILKDGLAVGIGSRAHMVNTEAVVKRSLIRNFLMHSFHTLLLLLGIHSIKDTQCGFKLLSRRAAQSIIPNMHVEGFIFDIEMLLLASWNKIPVIEVPINWHEVPGTKMNLVVDSVKMAKDLVVIRTCYAVGFWQVGRFVHRIGTGATSNGEGERSSSSNKTGEKRVKKDE
ncbi:hypothetical protein SeLEV6574_g05248 [Synchytrium endobioticum]|nr:hypothetical protein SeLEV6574_g05248 [Synchytrium endobioticum]